MKKQLNQLTLFAEASPAKTSRLPDAARAFLESEVDFGLSSIAFLERLGPDGASLRMSLGCYQATKDRTLPSSFKAWSNSGMASVGGFLTLNTSEFPSAAAVCSLSEVLEADVAPKFYLSPKACQGILRRAAKRGKALPEHLRAALDSAATQTPATETEVDESTLKNPKAE
jgi:hypothetical protein